MYSAKYLKIRKALAWRTYHQMRNIWKSTLSRKLKIRLIQTTAESVRLYGCETWTLTKTLLKQIHSNSTNEIKRTLVSESYKRSTVRGYRQNVDS